MTQMKTIQELPIRLVIASKLKQEDFLARSATGRSVKRFIKTSDAQVRLYPENAIGLSELYNKAIEEALEENVILVFIHDDVLIADYFWANKIRDGLERFDIVGVAGNSRRLPRQSSWIVVDDKGTLDQYQYLSGAIGQGRSFPPERLDVFGPTGMACKLMDGVFLAATTASLKKSSLRFDPRFGFHFYDVDFCRSAEMLNMKMGTIPLSLVHESLGKIDQEWHKSYQNYLNKWGN